MYNYPNILFKWLCTFDSYIKQWGTLLCICLDTFCVCGNSSRQISSLHSVSVTTVSSLDAGIILSLASFIRSATLPHVLIFDVLPLRTPPLSPWKRSLSSRRLYSNLTPHLPTYSPPPTFIFFIRALTEASRGCSESLNILVKESQLCTICYYTLQCPTAFTLLGFCSNSGFWLWWQCCLLHVMMHCFNSIGLMGTYSTIHLDFSVVFTR